MPRKPLPPGQASLGPELHAAKVAATARPDRPKISWPEALTLASRLMVLHRMPDGRTPTNAELVTWTGALASEMMDRWG